MLLDKLYSEDGEIWVFDDNLYLLKKYFNKLEDLFDNESHLINQCKAMEINGNQWVPMGINGNQ